jgi:hypothetical protein
MQYPLEYLNTTARHGTEQGPLEVRRRRGRQSEAGVHLEKIIQLLALIGIDWEGKGLLQSKVFDIRRDQTGCAMSYNHDGHILG